MAGVIELLAAQPFWFWGGLAVALLAIEAATGRRKWDYPTSKSWVNGTPAVRDALLAFPRQALHAASLGFRHPISGQALHFERPPPEDMAALLTLLDGNTE
jgi:hypothetical protein